MKDWREANPQYQSPVSVPQETLSQVLSLPPGAQRDQALQKAGLSAVAGRSVADGPPPGTMGELGYLTVTAERGVNIRRSPEVNEGTRLGTVPPGTVLIVQPAPAGVKPPDDGKNWTYVRSPPLEPGGQPVEGWVSADPAFVTPQGSAPVDGAAVTATTGPVMVPGTPGAGPTATAMFADAKGRLNPDATKWDYQCLPFVAVVAQSAGINDPALSTSNTPKEVIAYLNQEGEGRLHPMSEPPPPGAIVLWDKGGYSENGAYVQTGHAAIATGDSSSPYITTKVSSEGGVTQRTIGSLEADAQGNWSPTPPVGWFIPENPS
jgi:hypothetical protein